MTARSCTDNKIKDKKVVLVLNCFLIIINLLSGFLILRRSLGNRKSFRQKPGNGKKQ
jgi:hypothetical protein